VAGQPVPVGRHPGLQPVETRRPPDHAVAGMVLRVPAGDDLPGDLVDRETGYLTGAHTGVTREPALGAAESGQIAAAHPGGEEPQQHLTVAQPVRIRFGHLDPVETVRRGEAIGPHVTPPPRRRSSPTGNSTAAGRRPRRGSGTPGPGAAIR